MIIKLAILIFEEYKPVKPSSQLQIKFVFKLFKTHEPPLRQGFGSHDKFVKLKNPGTVFGLTQFPL